MDEHPLPPYATDDLQRQARARALRTMLTSGPVAVATLLAAPFASTWLESHGLEFARGPWLVLFAATPLVPFLLGLASWLSGRSRAELEAGWDGLAGWQRGVLGTVIVIAAAAVIFGGVAIALDRLAGR